MRRRLTLSILVVMLAMNIGCSKSKSDKQMAFIEGIDETNSVIDMIISKVDIALQDGVILSSFRNPDQRRPSIYKILKQLNTLDSSTDKPSIPDFYYYLAIKGQQTKTMKTFGIDLLVDPDITSLRLLSIETYDKIEYNKQLEITDDIKSELNQIIHSQ